MIDEIMACIAHESDAIEKPASDELSRDDHGIDGQGQLEPGSKMCIRSECRHGSQFRTGNAKQQALPKVSIKEVAVDYGTDLGGRRSLNTG